LALTIQHQLDVMDRLEQESARQLDASKNRLISA
jgi:hypothetical protein